MSGAVIFAAIVVGVTALFLGARGLFWGVVEQIERDDR